MVLQVSYKVQHNMVCSLCMNWKISVSSTKELWLPWELSTKTCLEHGMDVWSSRVVRACDQTAQHLVSWCCQHLGVHHWVLMAGKSQKAIFLTPAVPLLHPPLCPSCAEVSRWAAPEVTHACLQRREALVPSPRWKCCCWQAGSSVTWQQASESRLLCPYS